MMLVSQVIGGFTNIMYFGEPPASQAASRECEAPKNVKSPRCLRRGFSRSSPEHGSGARASRTIDTTRKP